MTESGNMWKEKDSKKLTADTGQNEQGLSPASLDAFFF